MGGQQSAPINGVNRENELMKLQIRREAAILVQDDSCSLAISKNTEEESPEILLDNLDQFLIKEKTDYNYYDFNFMYALSCAMRVGLVTDSQLNASKLVKEIFSDQKQIGGISVEGFALMVGEKGLKNMFIIKAPRDPANDNLVHEYFVAVGGVVSDLRGGQVNVIGTNWLRKVCLNYSQVVGAFRCGPPDIDPLSKQVRSWCDTTNKSRYVNYIIYEKIDGPDMEKLSKTMTVEVFVTLLIQVAYALEIGQIYNGFTHYDLHHQNLINRIVNPNNPGEEALIPFVISEELTVYISSAYIPTIIDYGRVHIQSPSPAAEKMGQPTEHFGFHASFGKQYGIYPDRARPYYDLYKLLGFTLYTMMDSKNPAFEDAWPIMGFFGLRSRDAVVQWLMKHRGSDLFSLADDIEKVGFCLTKQLDDETVCLPEQAATMFDFLQYVEAQFPSIWQSKVFGYPIEGIKVLECGADCGTFAKELTELKVDMNVTDGKLTKLGDLRNVIRYRNNLLARGEYFSKTFPNSAYGPRLVKEVKGLDADLTSQFDQIDVSFGEQILGRGEEAKATYAKIGYPIQIPQPSQDPNQTYQGLLQLQGFLDRMSDFAKAYTEFKEFFDAGKDILQIVGIGESPELRNYNETEITPLYQSYDNSRGQIRSYLESIRVPRELEGVRRDLYVRTL
jgi:hypothetical protein